MAEIQGVCDPRFEAVHQLLHNNLDSGADTGASVAVMLGGELVVDLWGGSVAANDATPWQRDTIVNVWSTTKTMMALSALLLVDRGLLDVDAPVSTYWPEFAQNGKHSVKVWHFMNHASGLSGMDQHMTPDDMYDWDKMVTTLAAQAPWWEPGSASGYHALTQGYLIGELVRRITGKSLGTFFQEEIAGPLNADFYIGVPDSEFPRIGALIPTGDGSAPSADNDSIAARTFASPFVPATQSWTDGWRRAEIPAANGHSNARAIARLQAPLACKGSAFGVDLFSKETAESVMQTRIAGTDMVLGVPIAFGLGFGLNSEVMPLSPNQNTCFWGGWGGSSVVVDQDASLSASFVMNKMFPGLMGDNRSMSLLQAVYQSL